ncbi:MAG: formate dehydrogenase subunit alpha [Tissierellales bacterium]|nr:formate dehydrogenase subunit alpha [Tissierellales bacterium]MBN2828588.1 formate dehydrogenase subunit alpha [Tissierellales bacterium]
MKKITININGKDFVAEETDSILKVCLENDIDIPNLCFHPDLDIKYGSSCRLCIVEIEGRKGLIPSCSTMVSEGMKVLTHSQEVVSARKVMLELIIENHPLDCLTCEKSGACKLQDYCYEYDVKGPIDIQHTFSLEEEYDIDDTNQFYIKDDSKCIQCGLCVRACAELQCINAIGFVNRSGEQRVSVPFGKTLAESDCVSCGTCVSLCPVNALSPKQTKKIRKWDIEKHVKTTCAYCGVGCQLSLLVKGNEVVGVEPSYSSTNKDLLCVKGKFAYGFINHSDRLKKPLIRKNGIFEEASWEEAYDLIVNKVKALKKDYGNESFAGLASARATNEDNYLFQKFIRAYLGNNNVDHCARLCHASTVAGLAATLGSAAMTNSNLEILDSDAIFIVGSNTTENHPVLGAFVKQAKNKGAQLIVADPRKIPIAHKADIYLPIRPGTNVALFNGMMNVIIEENLQDNQYIESFTENYEELKLMMKAYTPEFVGSICGVEPEQIRKAARIYAKAEKASILYSMGVTQHTTGTQGVMSLSNLALLTGNIGKESAGINPLRGQNNVQGACDMGGLPGDYPGYQKVYHEPARLKFEKAWGKELSPTAGLTVTEILNESGKGNIKFLYIMGENPMLSDPDINHVEEALRNTEFLVVQDIFMTETAELADVVLPATTFAEKNGTFTNSERRVQRVRKAIDPIGESKPDWVILMEIMNRLGMEEIYSDAESIFDEMRQLTPQYAGMTYKRLEDTGLQWPCIDETHIGTKYLHKYHPVRGKGLFKACEYVESAEDPDSEYPYLLTTGRILYHYHTRTMTGRVQGLNNLFPSSFIEINPTTASRLNIKDGELIRAVSRRGSIETTAVITEDIQEDIVFIPFHFGDGAANYLTSSVLDPIAKIPELKVSAIRIEKISDEKIAQ